MKRYLRILATMGVLPAAIGLVGSGTALAQSAERPDPWQVADSALEVGIGVCALFGGVLGTRAVRFLRDARTKSQALREIIQGNELFKTRHARQVPAFKAGRTELLDPDPRIACPPAMRVIPWEAPWLKMARVFRWSTPISFRNCRI